MISLLVAIPIAYYTMSHWLANYQYRTEPSLWIFGLSGLGALAITLITVSFQAIKLAAVANPVKKFTDGIKISFSVTVGCPAYYARAGVATWRVHGCGAIAQGV